MLKLEPNEYNLLVEKRISFLENLYLQHKEGKAIISFDLNDLSWLDGLTLNDLYYLIDHEYIKLLSQSSTGYTVRLSGKGVTKIEKD